MRPWYTLLAILLAGSASADVVFLNDGRKIEGRVRREGQAWVVTDSSGNVSRITDDQVLQIDKTGNLTDAQRSQSQLNALRHDAESFADPGVGVSKFRKYIDEHKGTPAAADAEADLKTWQERVDKGLTKVAGEWVTADQRDQLLLKTFKLVQEARDQYKQSRMRDVDATINSILAIDANNVSAIYLRALLLAKDDKVLPARKTFERVLELTPDHAATLNNLGVLWWQQKLYEKSISMYDKAMLASPKNRPILDNVAEALHALPKNLEDNATIKKAKKHFEDQDAALQKELADQGLHRWGANYINDAQMKQVEADKEKIDAKKQAIQDDYDRTRQLIGDNESAINMNLARMNEMRNDRVRIDAITGAMVQLPLPPEYWAAARDTDALRRRHDALVEKLNSYDQKVRQAEQDTPLPKYTGKQRLIEAEGIPLKPPPNAPTTQPVN